MSLPAELLRRGHTAHKVGREDEMSMPDVLVDTEVFVVPALELQGSF